MKSTKPFLKICGISCLEDALLAIELGVNAIGFIAYDKSPRFQTPDQIKKICQKLPKKFAKVLVTVNLHLNKLDEYIQAGINIIQLHGNENIEYAKMISLPIWRAIRLKNKKQIQQNFLYKMFIIDSISSNSQIYGGSGEKANWQLAKKFIQTNSTPTLIAGGININNFADALTITNAYGIDLSSSLEDYPAKKNHQKLKNFIKKLKNY